MNIPQFSLKHPSVIWILLAVVVGAGIYNYFTISQREDPEFTISMALVVTIYPGASAEKVERLVTKKIEEKIAEIATLEELSSTTRENVSAIFVRMNYYADMDMAWQKLRNAIAEVKSELPSGITGPMVIDDFGDVTAMIYSLSSDSASPKELRAWAKELRTRLKTVDSVGKVEILGEQEEAIYIEGSLDSFSMYAFSPLTASAFMDYQNVNLPSGYLRTPRNDYRLKVSGSFKLAENVENAVLDVSTKTGAPLKVKDVFKVRQAYKEPPLDFLLTDGKACIALDIRMKTGQNMVSMGDKVREVAKDFARTLPPNITLNLVHDQPSQIRSFIDTFFNKLLEGLVIVVFIMFLGMGLRSAGLIALALPFSILIAFAIMPLFHVDLETVSIVAFIIALGMLVDDAIIVTDNINVHLARGEDPKTAAWKGTQEIIIPVLTGTLATVFSFLPLLLMKEETGDYIRSLPIVVSAALLASLVLSVTTTPILSSYFLRAGKIGKPWGTGAFGRHYTRFMHWCLSHRKTVAAVTLLAFIGSFGLLAMVGFSFFPEAHRNQFLIDVWLPEGSSIRETESVARQIDDLLAKEPSVTGRMAAIGKGIPRFFVSIKPEFNANNYAQFMVNTTSPESAHPLIEKLNNELLKSVPGTRAHASKLIMGIPVEAPIGFRIKGPDLATAKDISRQIQDILRTTQGTYNIRDNLGEEVPYLKVNIDNEAAAMAGITNTEIAVALVTAYEGLPVTRLREGEDEVPVYFRLTEEERKRRDTLESLRVQSQTTKAKVPLLSFASFEPSWGAGIIKRHDSERTVTVLSEVRGRLASDIMQEIKPKIDSLSIPKGYRIMISGEEKERNKAFSQLGMVFALTVCLILLMLVIQFNSIKQALIILVSVPLAVIGAFLGLFISGNSFAFMPFLGIVSLAGIVIKDAVVWMEFAKHSQEQGMPIKDAVIQAGIQRLRPIILTAATAIGGLIPLALFGGVLWEGMASAMVFGLALATTLTLIVIPVFYYSVYRKKDMSA